MKKALRIKDNREFQSIIQTKKFVSSSFYSLYYVDKKDKVPRVGISSPTKLGNAVIRNKVRRQVRTMVQNIFSFEEDFDSVIIVKKKYLDQTYEENYDQLESAYKKVIMRRKREGVSNESI